MENNQSQVERPDEQEQRNIDARKAVLSNPVLADDCPCTLHPGADNMVEHILECTITEQGNCVCGAFPGVDNLLDHVTNCRAEAEAFDMHFKKGQDND